MCAIFYGPTKGQGTHMLTASSQLGPELILRSGLFFVARIVIPGLSGVAQPHSCHPLVVRQVVKRCIGRGRLLFFAGHVVPRGLSVPQRSGGILFAFAS